MSDDDRVEIVRREPVKIVEAFHDENGNLCIGVHPDYIVDTNNDGFMWFMLDPKEAAMLGRVFQSGDKPPANLQVIKGGDEA